jgi:hypothetical protein
LIEQLLSIFSVPSQAPSLGLNDFMTMGSGCPSEIRTEGTYLATGRRANQSATPLPLPNLSFCGVPLQFISKKQTLCTQMHKCTSARGTGQPPPVCGLHVRAAQRPHWHPSRMGRRHQVVIHRTCVLVLLQKNKSLRRKNTVYPKTWSTHTKFVKKCRWEQLQSLV